MPLYDYTCTDGHKFEELVSGKNVDVISCVVDGCTSIANRSTVYVVTTVGPVFDALEHYNAALLSPQQRAAGVELKTGSQIRAMEESLNLRPLDMRSTEAKVKLEDQMDDHQSIRNVALQDGKHAAADYIHKTEVQAKTGWGDVSYANWKRGHDAAIDAVKRGDVDTSSANERGAASKSPVRGT